VGRRRDAAAGHPAPPRPARAADLGRSDRMGRIAAGMDADFLLLDADPLGVAANLSSVPAVIRAGHHLTRDQIRAVADEAARGDHAAGLHAITRC